MLVSIKHDVKQFYDYLLIFLVQYTWKEVPCILSFFHIYTVFDPYLLILLLEV
jgi:hypothetical protein